MMICPEQGRPGSGFLLSYIVIAVFNKDAVNFNYFFSRASIVSCIEIEL